MENQNIDQLIYRIKEIRKRKEEMGITHEFLKGLNGFYNSFPGMAEKYEIKVYTVNMETIDLKTEKGRDKFLNEITKII